MPRVLVVGDFMLDRFWNGDVTRICPEAPVPVLSNVSVSSFAGGAGNVAISLSKLGNKVHCLGNIGDDPEGSILITMLSDYCDTSTIVKRKDLRTITKTRLMTGNHYLLRLDRDENYKPVELNHLNLNQFDLIYVADYSKGSIGHNTVSELRKNFGKKQILVDPKSSDWTIYKGASIIKPNNLEFDSALKLYPNLRDNFQELFNINTIVITKGKEGAEILDDKLSIECKAPWIQAVVEVTGAGDLFGAVLADCISNGISIKQASKMAIHACTLAVTLPGTCQVTKEIIDSINSLRHD